MKKKEKVSGRLENGEDDPDLVQVGQTRVS
jgi:hypothetical protein